MFKTKRWPPTPYVFDERQASLVACGVPTTTSVVAALKASVSTWGALIKDAV
jgi:hypothetical protein